MYYRNKNIFAYLLINLFIYLSPIKLFKFVPHSIIAIFHEKCNEISNKWTSLTLLQKLQKQINQEPRKETRKLSSNHPFLYPIIIDTKHREEGVHPSKGQGPHTFQERSLRNNYSQRGLTSLPPDLLVTNPK